MEFCIQLHKKAPRWLLLIVIIAVTHLLFQSLLLPYGNALQSLLLHTSNRAYNENILSLMQSSANSVMVRNTLAFDSSTTSNFSVLAEVINDSNDSTIIGVIGHSVASKRSNGSTEDAFLSEEERLGNPTELVDDGKIDDDFEPEIVMTENGASVLESAKIQQSNSDLELVNVAPKINNGSTETALASDEERPSNPTELVGEREVDDDFVSEIVIAKNEPFILESDRGQHSKSDLELVNEARDGPTFNESMKTNSQTSSDGMPLQDTSLAYKEVEAVSTTFRSPPVGNLTLAKKVTYLKQNETFNNYTVPLNYLESAKNDSAAVSNFRKRKMRCQMPPKSITTMDEMNQILLRHRRSSRSMRPRWSSARDQEILAAKMEIEKAPILKNDQDLYSPLFRNVSQFKRSYELMERVLKIYIYREGKRPIFHVPILKGLYASEGWFMKLMQGNKHYVVKDPRKAHLFYMPFSSRMLEYTLYVRNSHNRTNLRQHLKEYSEKIAAKYRFWNRTGGADHFLVACHDWAPYETRHHMEHCIKALCNADVTAGFKVGRDVSLPETYVRSARNPLKDLGGKPASRRNILAFYAGNMHGYLRPILLKHWKDKDPDMKIFGPMPPGVASKMNYIQHMKSSKYCICPKGYEVNSPRVVEAIFYECVPVIISDNFVPSFFEVFNWQAFSVILAENDIPNLKEILLSIPEEKYLKLQLGVRKVQRHFLWHGKPMKYDIFHMTLHSIWYNRVYQIKPR